MLRDTGSLTIETGKRSSRRAAGLLYSQFYSSVKEVFAAGNVYPFTNTAIETLALDKKLRKTWELVGGGLSHQPAALIKAYLYTKLRCHYALLGSMQKSFGTREEHRVSKELFYAIDSRIRCRELHEQRLIIPTDDNSPYHSFTSDTLLRWVRWNINKFCLGFEMVYSFQDPHFVTWEYTRIMLMFLRCLRFSYTGGLIQKVGGCWQDVRQQPDARQPNGLRRHEGLGFKITTYHIEQMDVKTSFLYGKIDEDIWVQQPEGFNDDSGRVYKLNKALYGLKPSPRIWYQTLSDYLTKLGFQPVHADVGIFVKDSTYIAVYVDDLLIVGPDMKEIERVKKQLSERFQMSDLGPCYHYFGITIKRDRARRRLYLSEDVHQEDTS
ncbi:unnamed protein product [Fusarium langsethiae]|nr:unnamed protein product [Fusarium langsethiae]